MHYGEKQVIKISLIGFLISFMLLLYFDYTHELETSRISELDLTDINHYVKITGEITRQSLINGNLFLRVTDEGADIDAVLFDTSLKLDKDKRYYFIGKVSLYKGELELIIDEIRLQT